MEIHVTEAECREKLESVNKDIEHKIKMSVINAENG